MNARQRRTLRAVFEKPTRADISWTDIESLFAALGGEVRQARGSRVTVALNGVRAVFHRPHPAPVTVKGAVRSVQRFLLAAGVMLER